MRPLIFDQLEIPWGTLGRPDSWEKLYSRDYLEDVGNLTLASFPTVCRFQGSQTSEIVATKTGLVFPRYGEWYVQSEIGVWKIFLRDPNDTEENDALKLCSFVAGNIYHSMADFYLTTKTGDSYPLNYERIWEKFWYSDQPVAFHCGQAVDLMSLILKYAGYVSRPVWFRNERNSSHVAAEVWLPGDQRWIFIDPDFGILFRSRSSSKRRKVLSFEELADGRPRSTLAVFAWKWPTRFANKPMGFVGQVTWRPELMKRPTRKVMDELKSYYKSFALGDSKVTEWILYEYSTLEIENIVAIHLRPDDAAFDRRRGQTN